MKGKNYALIACTCMLLSTTLNSVSGQISNWDRKGFTVPMFSYEFELLNDADGKRQGSIEAMAATGANSIIFDYHFEVQMLTNDHDTDYPRIDPIANSVEWFRGNDRTAILLDQIKRTHDYYQSIGKEVEIIVKPLLNVIKANGAESAVWQYIDPQNEATFFSNYQSKVMSVINADDAADQLIDAVILGNELNSLTTKESNNQYWVNLANAVKAVRPGSNRIKVGYNAGAFLGWSQAQAEDQVLRREEYYHVTFKDAADGVLDFFGFSSYPRLLDDPYNLSNYRSRTYNKYLEGWESAHALSRNIIAEVEAFCDAHQHLDIYFTELGTPACDGGIYGDQFNGCTGTRDEEGQALFYEASFDALNGITKSNFKGIFIYDWLGVNTGTIIEDTKPDAPYRWNVFDKPAEAIITQYFSNDPGGPGNGDWVFVDDENFEGTWKWNGNANTFTDNFGNACGGSFSVGFDGPGQLTLVSPVNLQDADEARITFSYRTFRFDSPDQFIVEYSSNNGSSWSTIGTFQRSASQEYTDCMTADAIVSSNLTQNAKFRFRSLAQNGDFLYIDDILIEKRGGGGDPVDCNLVQNGDFSGGNTNPWENVGAASFVLSGQQLRVNVGSTGGQFWQAKAQQKNITLTAGQEYQIKYRIKTVSGTKSVRVVVDQNGQYQNRSYTGNHTINANGFTEIDQTFSVGAGNGGNNWIIFLLGSDPDDVIIDDVEIQLVNCGSALITANVQIDDLQPISKDVFHFYPNPTFGLINIESAVDYSLVIYDVVGKQVRSLSALSGLQQIDLTDLNSGTYFIRYDNGQQRITEKFIIE